MPDPRALAAREIGSSALGRDTGPMALAPSLSHAVYVGADVVVKLIGADDHARLGREVGLAPHLPAGITPPLLAAGVTSVDGAELRYACYRRASGSSPGLHLTGVDRGTALALAGQAITSLETLHGWSPPPEAARILSEELDHGGFLGRSGLVALVADVGAAGGAALLGDGLLGALSAIAERSAVDVRCSVPVHADCHWGNWLIDGHAVTALLDFEWARFGDPLDDWFFLARFSGDHLTDVVDLVVERTGADPEAVRAGCESREISHVLADLLILLRDPAAGAPAELDHMRDLLHAVAVDRIWWTDAARRSTS